MPKMSAAREIALAYNIFLNNHTLFSMLQTLKFANHYGSSTFAPSHVLHVGIILLYLFL